MSSRPCTCDNVTGPQWSSDQCRLCWLYRYDARYTAVWDGTDQPEKAGFKARPYPEAQQIASRAVLGIEKLRSCVHRGRAARQQDGALLMAANP